MQLVGGFVLEAVSSGSPAVVQALCNAVPDIMVIHNMDYLPHTSQLFTMTNLPHQSNACLMLQDCLP